MTVFYCSFDSPLPESQWDEYLGTVPPAMIETIGKYRRWQDRHASLFGKLLLKKGLEQFGERSDQLHTMQFTQYGRPYLPLNIDFNISHSRNYVVCAFSYTGKIGIDVEYINDKISIDDFTNVLTPTEYSTLQQSSQQAADFFEYWCKKESIIKADGRGFSAPVLGIALQQHQATLERKVYYLKEVPFSAEYKAFVAQAKPIDDLRLVECRF